MNVTSAGAAGAVSNASAGDGATVAVAAKGLAQLKQDGANAVALIQTAVPPPQGARGQNVNTLA